MHNLCQHTTLLSNGAVLNMACHASVHQVKVKVSALHGQLPYVQQCCDQLGHFHPTAAFAVAQLSAGGQVLGLATQTTYADTMQEGCMWSEWLTFCVKVRPSHHPLPEVGLNHASGVAIPQPMSIGQWRKGYITVLI